VPEGLLLVVWSSIGLWVVGWVGLWVQSFYSAVGWVGSLVWWVGLGWVEEIGPTDNSVPSYKVSDRNTCLGERQMITDESNNLLPSSAVQMWASLRLANNRRRRHYASGRPLSVR